MKTLYIDVYFLVNFIIDLLSLYFATVFSAIPSTQRRLLIGSLFGALSAVALVFLPSSFIIMSIASVIYVLFLVFTVANGVSNYRRLKFAFSFYIAEFLIGGFVQFFYGVLDKRLLNYLPSHEETDGSRRLILLALIILMCVGLLRILSGLFSSRLSGNAIKVEITFRGKTVSFDAFCDTGNLVKDPFDMSPVLIVKSEVISPLIPEIQQNLLTSDAIASSCIDYSLKKRIRLIPIKRAGKTITLLAIKPDGICVFTGSNAEKISATVAIDNEGGTYGGYNGLIPTAAIRDVLV